MASAAGSIADGCADTVVGNGIETVKASDFLDEVLLDGEIEAIRRRGYQEILVGAGKGEAETTEKCGNGLTGYGNAQQARDACGANAYRSACGQGSPHIGQRPGAAAAAIEDQLRRALDGACASREIDPAFETIAGVARETETPRLALDDGRIPEGAFEQHAGRRIADPGVLAAHDAGEAQRLFRIGDEQQIELEVERLLVQERELFAGLREAHDDRTFEQLIVVGVQRLPQFEHHVVGDVDDRRNGTNPAAFEAPLHPGRRLRSGIDCLDDA